MKCFAFAAESKVERKNLFRKYIFVNFCFENSDERLEEEQKMTKERILYENKF